MSRLFRSPPPAEADVRPTLLGVVTLLFLLLFFLLTTSTGQRLGVIGLRLGSAADLAPLPHAGLLRTLEVDMEGGTLRVLAEVQTTDIAAASTSVERRQFELPPVQGSVDLAGLARLVEEFHALDPSQTRARLRPDETTGTGALVAVLDVMRGGSDAPRFPNVALVGLGE